METYTRAAIVQTRLIMSFESKLYQDITKTLTKWLTMLMEQYCH